MKDWISQDNEQNNNPALVVRFTWRSHMCKWSIAAHSTNNPYFKKPATLVYLTKVVAIF